MSNKNNDITHIKDLTPDPQNARRHNPRNIGAIERSLNEVGAARSIVVDEDGVILAGNGLVEAAAQAGIERVRVIDADGDEIIAVRRTGLTDVQKIKLALFDNRTNELSEWEPAVLAAIAARGDVVIDPALFSSEEWKAASQVALPDAQDDPSVSVDEGEETRCHPGDVWRVGRHIVACLDSTDRANVERLIAGRKVGMVVADPPYGMQLDTSYDNSVTNTERGIRKSRGYAPVVGDDKDFDPTLFLEVFESVKEQFWFGADYYRTFVPDDGSWLVWDKRAGLPEFDYSSSEFELCWTKTPHLREILRIRWFGAFGMEQEGGAKRAHPTQKPIAVYLHLLKYGAPTDLIFDPFLGSGPSLKAAEQSGRTVIGCELSPVYCDHIIEWSESHGLTCELQSTSL